MFTGIVEEKGKIKNIKKDSNQAFEFEIEAELILEDMKLGDSISVDGICLTVTNFNKNSFFVDVMPETVKATTINQLNIGHLVNLERAMLPTTRLGGHFVTGHVDGVGKIINKIKKENAVYYTIEIPQLLTMYFIDKGSVTIDGISLTVFGINKQTLIISLIPHTISQTVLGNKEVGHLVNIECDLLAKHVKKQLSKREDTIYV